MAWSDTILRARKDSGVRLVAYVPHNVLTPLISGVSTRSARWRGATFTGEVEP
jgi:hypothetical protein